MSQNILQSFEIKNELNPRIWVNAETNDFAKIKIKPDIRKHLLEIAKEFLDFTELTKEELEIHDVFITGSISNYNWSIYSDIDLHILMNHMIINDDKELAKEFLQTKKALFNKKHNFTIKDHIVEIYPQPLDQEHHATGMYSVLKDEWIETPNREYFKVNKNNVEKKAQPFIDEIEMIQKSYEQNEDKQKILDQINELKKRISDYRNAGLDKGGETSDENLAFKYLRRAGYLDILSDLKLTIQDELLSIEEIKR